MRQRTWLALAVLTVVIGAPLALIGQDPTPAPPPSARLLPGMQRDGFVQLPNQWRLRPVGRQLQLGDFPVQIAAHPSGKFLAVLHCGYRDHEIVIVGLAGNRQRIISRAVIDQAFYGVTFTPDGNTLYASGGEYEVIHAFDHRDGYLSNHRQFRVAPAKERFVVAGLAVSSAGRSIYAAGLLGNAVAVLDAANGKVTKKIMLGAPPLTPDQAGPKFRDNEDDPLPGTGDGAFPYAILPTPDGKRLFVSLWNHAQVAVIDIEAGTVTARWATASHPTEMALRPDGKALYVACANSTQVSVLDPTDGKSLQTLNCALYPQAPSGNTPASLSLTPDGEMLYVANADNNNVAVFNTADAKKAVPLGFIPVGWYPTSVRYLPEQKQLYVTNGKGIAPKSNRHGNQPGLPSLGEYIAGIYHGTLSTIDAPTPDTLARYTQAAYKCSPLKADTGVSAEPPAGSPIPAKVGDSSPIKYCIYIIKENRTYDQVFGDIKEGNGDPSLCLFPEKVTPNHHALARKFVLLDNFYVEAEVSADGHEWSMGAYATDFVEKTWPLTYRSPKQNKLTYPSEGGWDRIARPAGGYLWDRAKEAGVSYRSYGEWVANGKTINDPCTARVPALEGHFDPQYRSYDLDYPDVKRTERFISELKRFEKEGEMPRLQIVRLPNDHTYGTRIGKPTPTALVADNDLALGQLVEAVSKSKFWPQTAIFVLEDDAQNGPDHVDAHRSIALVVSPYAKRGAVDSAMYSTASMLRTMELILGLKPMSQFDAAARPMYGSFTDQVDLRPYEHKMPNVDREEKNSAKAWGVDLSEKLDLTKEDVADDLLFNEIIWRSVKGPHSKMPAPVRAAFVWPKGGEKKEEDD